MPNRTYHQGPGIVELRHVLVQLAAELQPQHEQPLNVEFRRCPRGRAPYYELYEKKSIQSFFSFFHKHEEVPLARIDAVFYTTPEGSQVCLRTFETDMRKPLANRLRETIKNTFASNRVQSIRIY